MIASDLINQMIPPLKLNDSTQRALKWMDELRINQLPVVENGQYLGLISEDMIYQQNQNTLIVDLGELILPNIYAIEDQHFYDVITLSSNYQLQVIAILDQQQSFLGVISLNDTITAFAETIAIKEPGAIFVLSLDQRDYSLTEISRLVESNNAKVLSTYLTENSQNPHKINVTIKVNRTEINDIIATFERFDYKVIAKFLGVSNEPDLDQERMDMLMKYLSI